MRVLYRRTKKEIPADWVLNKVECDIRDNWYYGVNLFTFSQMCDRNDISKRACRRSLSRFITNGIVTIWDKE